MKYLVFSACVCNLQVPKTTIMKNVLLMGLFVLFGTACTKEIPGPQGPSGPAGSNGNANVRSRSFVSQSFFFNTAANVYEVFLDWDGLTAEVVNKGSVQVYIAPANNNGIEWNFLPGNFTPDIANVPSVRFEVQVITGRVAVFSASNPGFAADFRVVATAGSE